MPLFLDTRGRSKLAIGICARCSLKFPYDELRPDPNYPGLFVCSDDMDDLDPYRLAPRSVEDITLEHPRPDVGLTTPSSTPLWVAPPTTLIYLTDDFGNFITDDFGAPIILGPSGLSAGSPIPLPSAIQPTQPWQASTGYQPGASVTPLNQNNPSVQLPQLWFVCVFPGASGAVAPIWPTKAGVVLIDGTVTWLCLGIYLDEGIGSAFAAPVPSAT